MADTPERSSKTERPTARRLEEARNKGNLPLSRDFTAVLMIGALTIFLALWGGSIAYPLVARLADAFDATRSADISTSDELIAYAGSFFGDALLLTAPLFGVLVVAVVAAQLAQGSLVVSSERVRPQIERVSPLAGFKRLFSATAFVEVAKGCLKITLVLLVGIAAVGPLSGDLNGLFYADAVALSKSIAEGTNRLLTHVVAAMLIVSAFDVGWQRFSWWRNLFMTRHELKEEFRQSEGSPEVKGRLKALRRQRASRRMMAAVPEATVIITNPTHFAIALQYERSNMRAPICIAKGRDAIAMRIRAVAQDSEVPIVENKSLARALFASVEIGDEVPPAHYKAVAEIISYVLSLRRATA